MILITQNLFHQAKHCRNILLNAKYIVLLKNTRETNQFTNLERQVYPEDTAGLYKAYHEATDKPHDYLVLHFAQDTVSNQHNFERGAICILYSINL